jgi:CRP-like cAMP-binding protein
MHLRLSQFLTLTPNEISLLGELQKNSYAVPRNRDVIVQGYHYTSVFLLKQGAAIRYKIMHDGRRQIVNFVLPGELIGFPACLFETSLYSVSTLTEAIVAPITFDEIRALFGHSSRLAAAMFWQSARESAMYAEHLVDIGRRSAFERVGHLLLELVCRLRVIGLAEARSFDFPLTQELMADALGLSVVHVNRTFRRLRESGLVDVDGHHFVFKNLEGLAQLVDFESSYLSRFRISGLPFAD